jgi:spore germination protein KC
LIKGVWRLLLLICALVSLTGCWDHKVMQDLAYVTALGIDYEDNQFVVYAHMLDFSTVGKIEAGKGEGNIWVEKGKGPTVAVAIDDLFNSAQQRTFFGYVMTVVYSRKALLQKDMALTFDAFERYTENRYTPLLYSTLEPIEELFLLRSIIPNDPLMTLLLSPEGNYKQHSILRPIELLEFAALYREPSSTAIIPTLSINRMDWKKTDGKIPVMIMNGAIFVHQGKKPLWLSRDDLLGMRWLEEKTEHTPLTLNDNEGRIKALMICEDPKVQVIPEISPNGDPLYKIHIKVKATVTQLNTSMTKSQLQSEAKAAIQSEIRTTFAAGLKKNVDVYHLEEFMFRKKNADWKKLTQVQGFPLTAETLDDIQVDVTVSNAGKKKLRG